MFIALYKPRLKKTDRKHFVTYHVSFNFRINVDSSFLVHREHITYILLCTILHNWQLSLSRFHENGC